MVSSSAWQQAQQENVAVGCAHGRCRSDQERRATCGAPADCTISEPMTLLAARDPRVLVRPVAAPRARRMVPQGSRIRRDDPRALSAMRCRVGARRHACARCRMTTLTTRSRTSCCSTSSRATRSATRRARSPATRQALATAIARRRCRIAIAALDRFERWFLYMPFEHAEDLAMQRARSIALFARARRRNRRHARCSSGPRSTRRSSAASAAILHRNAILGRASTPRRSRSCSEPGSRF